ncbi:UDP-N-acetylmuramate dehydrogenase [Aestuariispira insulae]|uniref:UDP-N-acetylenolpyruvoylglucosamine reductase n=1 Tax=Aestuariispira insulae TaxID=1461337 RepID=A0A3D9HYY4_9PROT|nr:UDP-N-acetylmuramate dehydrogenase [Aestuariispira insulae]RED54116.1 UDP-N-acetylmuramate dehydrogenase [Aestuariispira insulae]
MAALKQNDNARLIERLPKVRGRYAEAAPLSKVTWFRVGGPADILFKPADLEDLQNFLRNRPTDIPVTVIGVGSNLLVRDGGVRGVVIKMGGDFARITVDGDVVTAGAAALDLNVAKTAAKEGRAGLEFLSGIPGTIGGALRMNAGAYGAETKDVLETAFALDPSGEMHELSAADMGFSYRKSSIPADWIFVKASFRTQHGDKDQILTRMEEIQKSRSESQPIRSQTGGSTFKNPEGHKSWQLIDDAGCRGLMVGGAQMSEMHCNFMINTGNATAADLEGLGEEVRTRVKAKSGVELQWEIKRIGEASQ